MIRVVPDAIFDDRRLAAVYDQLDPDRSDLDVYVAMADQLGARSVLDIGCGTGTFACTLAGRGIAVIAVDLAAAMLEVARAKVGAHTVRWVHGDATALPPVQVDAAFMTGNVAQVFLSDDAWTATLHATRRALLPDGWLVFETRVPARRAWEQWTPERTFTAIDVAGLGMVESWEEVVDASPSLVTFRSVTTFSRDALVLESVSTLRFRDLPEIEASLFAAGFDIVEVRDAPDRPGLEFVVLARPATPGRPS
jgi:ubiquinone/menaquinone biosynthesis C-methylase UbiE